jgi:hypothetical protein
MNVLLRSVLSALAALAVIGPSVAAETPKPKLNTTTTVEATASEVVLPSSVDGTLVMKACAGCALKSYPVTAATRYLVARKPATLAELTASVAGKPKAFVGVTYSRKTGEILAVKTYPVLVGQP